MVGERRSPPPRRGRRRPHATGAAIHTTPHGAGRGGCWRRHTDGRRGAGRETVKCPTRGRDVSKRRGGGERGRSQQVGAGGWDGAERRFFRPPGRGNPHRARPPSRWGPLAKDGAAGDAARAGMGVMATIRTALRALWPAWNGTARCQREGEHAAVGRHAGGESGRPHGVTLPPWGLPSVSSPPCRRQQTRWPPATATPVDRHAPSFPRDGQKCLPWPCSCWTAPASVGWSVARGVRLPPHAPLLSSARASARRHRAAYSGGATPDVRRRYPCRARRNDGGVVFPSDKCPTPRAPLVLPPPPAPQSLPPLVSGVPLAAALALTRPPGIPPPPRPASRHAHTGGACRHRRRPRLTDRCCQCPYSRRPRLELCCEARKGDGRG